MGFFKDLLAAMQLDAMDAQLGAMDAEQLVELLPSMMEGVALVSGPHPLQAAADKRFRRLSVPEQREALIAGLSHHEGRVRSVASERLAFWQNSPPVTLAMADALNDPLRDVRFHAALHIMSCGRCKDLGQVRLVLDRLREARKREQDSMIVESLDSAISLLEKVLP
jgi:hypothetical protein